MRQDRFTLDNIMKYLYGEQISKIPKSYYNKDMQKKYLDFGSSFLYACHGDRCQHIKRWIRERLVYMDTLMQYNVSTSDFITIRANHQGLVYLDLQTYVPMYLRVKWRDEANDSGTQIKRVGRGETVHFEYTMPTATDQEVIIYGGKYLKDLGDLTPLQPTTMLISNAYRLTKVEVHSSNLINTDLSKCTYLQEIDISDCSALGTGEGAQPTLNLENTKYLRKIDARNTKLTAIYTNQSGGNIEEIYYPQSIQQIVLSNQKFLTTLGLPYGYSNMLSYHSSVKNKMWTRIGGTIDASKIEDWQITNRTDTINSLCYETPIKVEETKEYEFITPKSGATLSIYEFDKDNNVGIIKYDTSSLSDATHVSYIPSTNVNKILIDVCDDSENSFGYEGLASIRMILKEVGDSFLECKNLNEINITNCKNITKMCDPYNPNEDQFLAFKNVQNINLRNSLNLSSLNFDQFKKLRTITLASLQNLTDLKFNDMAAIGTEATISKITLSDLPLLKDVKFNVTSDEYTISFAKGAVIDMAAAESIKSIYSNYPIQGLDKIILPPYIENLYFTKEYGGDLVCSIRNIWSPNANHSNDDFQGIDFKDMHIKNIDMSALKNISNAANFEIAPTTVNPNFNTGRDGIEYKYFSPIGTADLTNYTGSFVKFFNGVNLEDLKIICNKDLQQTDYSYCFYGSIFNSTDTIIDLIKRMVNVSNASYMFYKTNISGISILDQMNLNLNCITDYMF